MSVTFIRLAAERLRDPCRSFDPRLLTRYRAPVLLPCWRPSRRSPGFDPHGCSWLF
jgi:hypothetical protein